MINIMLEEINEENEKCMCLCKPCKPCKSPDNVSKVLDKINDEGEEWVYVCMLTGASLQIWSTSLTPRPQKPC